MSEDWLPMRFPSKLNTVVEVCISKDDNLTFEIRSEGALEQLDAWPYVGPAG